MVWNTIYGRCHFLENENKVLHTMYDNRVEEFIKLLKEVKEDKNNIHIHVDKEESDEK